MDFEVSEQMETILTMVREFVDDELIPIEGEMLHGSPETVQELVVAAQHKVRQMDLWAPNHPVEFGGLGLSMVDHGLLSEALGRSRSSTSTPPRSSASGSCARWSRGRSAAASR
jgi:acyl-CoA dehydrogenase